MNEELQKKLLSSLDKITEYLEATEGFVSEQAPIVCREIVAWGICSNLVECLTLASLSFALYSTARWAARRTDTENSCREGYFTLTAAVGISSVVFAALSGKSLVCSIKPMVAPRLYIIEQIANLF